MDKREIVLALEEIREKSWQTTNMLESRNILGKGIDNLVKELESQESAKLEKGELFISVDVDFSDAIHSQNDVHRVISYIKGLNAAIHRILSEKNKINLGVDINEWR